MPQKLSIWSIDSTEMEDLGYRNSMKTRESIISVNEGYTNFISVAKIENHPSPHSKRSALYHVVFRRLCHSNPKKGNVKLTEMFLDKEDLMAIFDEDVYYGLV